MSGKAAQCNQGQLGIRKVVNSPLFNTIPSVVAYHFMTNSTNFSIFKEPSLELSIFELISLSSLEIIKAQMKYSTSPILYSSFYPAYMVFKRWIQCYWFMLIIVHCTFFWFSPPKFSVFCEHLWKEQNMTILQMLSY